VTTIRHHPLAGSIKVVALGIVILVSVVPARAQESRAEAIAAEQAKKADDLHPYVPSRAEQRTMLVKQALFGDPTGLYPYFDSVYGGGGFTLGAGYRRFLGPQTIWDVRGLYSVRSYKLIELSAVSPGHARQTIDLHARAGWRDATQIRFHGLGIDSPRDRTNFRMKQAYAGGDLRARPWRSIVFGVGLSYEDFTSDQGRGSAPSIETVHTLASAPGLGTDPAFVHTMVSAGVDWRPSAGYARRGGLYEAVYHKYHDRDETQTFDRLDVQLVQHLPILRENWVVSLQGLLQTTLDPDARVPHFLLPSLGGSSRLRGYHSWRFRDRHSLLLSGEWRWIPNRLGLDAALFFEAGTVAAERAALDIDDVKINAGFGVRFHGPAATPVRIELARGSEGLRIVFAGNPAF
jgi:hypothetical protein